MFRLRAKTDFDAAHRLVGYKGKCANLHGHLWVVETFIIGESLDKLGMLVDFGDIKVLVNQIIDKLDHTYLNDIPEIGNPTSEHVAKYIYEELKKILPTERYFTLEKVRVWETPRSWAEYFEG